MRELKQNALPDASESELDDIRVAIYHPDHPSFPSGAIERPPNDAALRVVLEKYDSNSIFELVIDPETPDKKYSDYTALDGQRRYGTPSALITQRPNIPLKRSVLDAALRRLYDEVESRLNLEPVDIASCFFVQACTLFPALSMEFNKPTSSNLGQGTVDIAITSAAKNSRIVGFVSIDKDFKAAVARNMIQTGVGS